MQKPMIEPVSGALRVAGGMRLEDADPYAATLTPPPKAARGREDERLFILVDLNDAASSHVGRELREVVTQAYWSSAGSTTAALRRAATAANRHLFQINLNAAPSERRYGGLTCAVLRGEDLFILQVGPGRAYFLRGGRLRRFPRAEEPARMGIGPAADVRLHHTFVTIGDALLLASSALVQKVDDADLARLLPHAELEEVLAGLEQFGADADFAALAVRWKQVERRPVEDVPPVRKAAQPQAREASERPSARLIGARGPSEPRGRRPEPPARVVEEERSVRERKRPSRRGESLRKLGLDVGQRIRAGVRYLVGHGLGYVWRGIVAIGTSVVAFIKLLAGAMGALFRRALPGVRRKTGRRARRPVPEENRTVMMAIALGMPILVVVVVLLAYMRLGAESRFQGLINQAQNEIALAQAAEDDSEEARSHWQAALELAEAAAALHPDEPAAKALQDQAQAAIDRLDQVNRLTLTQLFDFGSQNVMRRLVVHGRMLFILDPTDGWAARVSLNQASDGVVEEDAPILVHTGQQVDGDGVGNLVDCVWVDRGSGRQTSALLILEEDGALLSYNPAWEGEGGAPHLERSFLGTSPTGARAVGAFDGRFYVLDTIADGNGQIWRYMPDGDAYPGQPQRYFTNPPSKALADTVDMAIDGNIYILYTDGSIFKFLGGEPEPFDVRNVPGDLSQAVAFAVDPDGSEAVYVADRGNRRIVVLEPDGAFRAQFRAGDAFDRLEALAVDEADRRLYVLSGGRLYTAPF